MTTIKECLHSETADMKLVNVKFFRGDKRYITPDEFRAQLRAAAEFQVANPGVRTRSAPHSGKQKINVRERVANL